MQFTCWTSRTYAGWCNFELLISCTLRPLKNAWASTRLCGLAEIETTYCWCLRPLFLCNTLIWWCGAVRLIRCVRGRLQWDGSLFSLWHLSLFLLVMVSWCHRPPVYAFCRSFWHITADTHRLAYWSNDSVFLATISETGTGMVLAILMFHCRQEGDLECPTFEYSLFLYSGRMVMVLG